MTLKTRRFLFLILSSLFLIVGTNLILYSAGIGIDWKNLHFVQTGGIYIEADPSDVQIEINGSALKSGAGLLRTGVFVNNLIPDKYKIVVSKLGYFTWEKQTEVLPQSVSVFNKIILVPRREPQKISAAPSDFYIRNDRLIVKNEVGLTYNERKVLANEVIKLLDSGSVITRSDKTGNYYFSTLSLLNSSLNLSLIFNNLRESLLGATGAIPISKIEPYQYNDRKFIVKSGQTLFSLDIDKLILEQIATNVKDFTIGKSDLFWLDEKNYLFRYNLPLRNKMDIPITLPITSKIINFEVSPSGEELAILEENNHALTLFDKNHMESRRISSGVKDFSFSYNSKFLAFTKEDGKIIVYKPDADKLFEMKPTLDAAFKNPTWYRDDAHLFVQDHKDNLYFMEMDDREPQNFYSVGSEVRKYIYDKSANQVYFSNPSGLFKVEI